MSYENEIYEVPWCSDRWEAAIWKRPNIAFFGRPGKWVLYRPTRVLVTAPALRDDRVQALLSSSGADRCAAPGADVARELELELFDAPEPRVVQLVREINAIVPCSASLEHLLMPGPHHVHGDDDPLSAPNPGNIPGTVDAGQNVKVLVLDTGFAAPQPFTVTMQTTDAEIVDEDADHLRDPAAGHGTHVAGVIARIAPRATIVVHRLLTGPVGEATDIDVAAALMNHGGAHIINCSFGEITLDDAAPIVVQQALANLPSSTVVVAASGNGGVSHLNWPAAFDRVVGVGAVGKPGGAGPWLQTDFSNHGPWVNCCAPGVGIVSTFLHRPEEGFDGFASWTGTSMACPAVAGSIAALATRPGMDVASAKAQVLAGTPIGDIGALVDPATL